MKYRVVKITNCIEQYPSCEKDTKEFPHIVRDVEGEMNLFIIDENGDYWQADEFFSMTNIEQFESI